MTKDVSEKDFEKIVEIVSDKDVVPEKQATRAQKLRLYGCYKRATHGKLLPPYSGHDKYVDQRPKSRPGVFSVEARSKYDAWAECQDMSKQEAMNEYAKVASDTVGEKVKNILK